ncbi:RING finger protein, partial [Corchorus olitorius]
VQQTTFIPHIIPPGNDPYRRDRYVQTPGALHDRPAVLRSCSPSPELYPRRRRAAPDPERGQQAGGAARRDAAPPLVPAYPQAPATHACGQPVPGRGQQDPYPGRHVQPLRAHLRRADRDIESSHSTQFWRALADPAPQRLRQTAREHPPRHPQRDGTVCLAAGLGGCGVLLWPGHLAGGHLRGAVR